MKAGGGGKGSFLPLACSVFAQRYVLCRFGVGFGLRVFPFPPQKSMPFVGL